MNQLRLALPLAIVLAAGGCNLLLQNETGEVPVLAEAGHSNGSAGTAGAGGSSVTEGGSDRAESLDAALEANTTTLDSAAEADERRVLDAASFDSDAPGYRCTGIDDCGSGFNCWKGACVAALVSCAAQKSTYAASPDGVYWINPSGTPMRAYCDMQQVVDLCTEIEDTHRGKTREGSQLAFTMRSVLHVRDGDCVIWALKSSADGYPLGVLKEVAGQTLSTCQVLGFPADGELGSCPFGDSAGHTGCGFQSAPPYYQYGNVCSGCVEGEGTHKAYVKQGPIYTSAVLSSAGGSTQSHCKIR